MPIAIILYRTFCFVKNILAQSLYFYHFTHHWFGQIASALFNSKIKFNSVYIWKQNIFLIIESATKT